MAAKFTPGTQGSRAARPGQTVRGPSGSSETFAAAQQRQRGVKKAPTNRFGPETPVAPEKSFSSRQLAAMDTDKLLGSYSDGTRTNPFEVINVPTRAAMGQWVDFIDEYDQDQFDPKTSNVGSNVGLRQGGNRQPAPQTIIPTSTTNPERPRTLSAGYEQASGSQTGKLTVQFRDGTMYNYYDVPVTVWQAFKASPSKGRFIRIALDSYSRGYASGSSGSTGRQALHKAAKTAQRHIHNRRGPATTKAVQVSRQSR